MTLKDTRVVVVGGTSGIGRETALLLAEHGAQVTATGRSADKLAALAADAPALSTGAVDSTDRTALNGFFAAHGPLDHLVVCASGGEGGGPFASLDLDAVRRAFEAKTFAQLQTVQAALPHLTATGSITMVTAVSALAAMPGTTGLAAVNGALEAAVRPLAAELAPVRVNAVSPGVIDTPWWHSLPAQEREAVFAATAGNLPAGRIGRPEEVAAAIAALLDNGFITGHILPADGGAHLAR
ncbi:SDR family oxidoreductase [Streptomyces sp. NPDC001781]